jgi:hypothetical protein
MVSTPGLGDHMTKFNRGWAAALAWLVVGVFAHPAWAQSEEGRQLSREIAHKVLSAVPADTLVQGASGGLGFLSRDFPQRPEWKGFFVDALTEEFDADRPVIEDILGDVVAKAVTVEELRAGVVMFRGAAGDNIAAIISATVRHEKPPAPGRELEDAYRKLAADPAGRGFTDKLEHVDKLIQSATSDVVLALLPGVMRRFGEKAEVAERARRAAHP